MLILEATIINKVGEKAPRVILVGLRHSRRNGSDFEGFMRELEALVEAAGVTVVGTLVQSRDKPDQRSYIGRGKIAELVHLVEETGADMVVFDHELSPGQLRFLEEQVPARIIERTGLILDIFSSRAHSLEGKLQVEPASLQYQLPRLGAGPG